MKKLWMAVLLLPVFSLWAQPLDQYFVKQNPFPASLLGETEDAVLLSVPKEIIEKSEDEISSAPLAKTRSIVITQEDLHKEDAQGTVKIRSAAKDYLGRIESNFRIATEGDYWIIKEDNIPVLKERKTSANMAQFRRNLVTLTGGGTKVEILESKGILSPWKRVYIYDDQDKIYAEGWILAEIVKNAVRVKKGAFSP